MKVALTFCLLSLVLLASCLASSSEHKTSIQRKNSKQSLLKTKRGKKKTNIVKRRSSRKKRKMKNKKKSQSNKNRKIRKQKASKNRKLKERRNKRKQRNRKLKERRNKRKQRKRKNSKNKQRQKGQRQSSTTASPLTCDIEKAFKDFKKASEYKKKIDRVVKFTGQLKKKANVTSSSFQHFIDLLATATNNGTTCTTDAKNAYKFLQSCLLTIPNLCSSPDINLTEAKDCVNTTTSSFAKFLKCATPKNVKLCDCYTNIDPEFPDTCGDFTDLASDVTNNRKLCLNATVTGSFSNCMQFVKNEVPMIIEKCLDSENCSTTTTTMTPTPITTTSQSLKVNSSTIFVQGDEVVEQTQSYDPNTKQLTVSVPAHGDREAVTVIYGEASMVTAYTAYCLVGDTPEEMDTSSYESPKPESSTTVNSSSVNSVFIFNVIDENEMTDNEKESLPESFRKLCENKSIRKSSSVYVDETIFEKSTIFNNTLLQQKSSANQKFQYSAYRKYESSANRKYESSANKKYESPVNEKYESSAGWSRSKRQADTNDEVQIYYLDMYLFILIRQYIKGGLYEDRQILYFHFHSSKWTGDYPPQQLCNNYLSGLH